MVPMIRSKFLVHFKFLLHGLLAKKTLPGEREEKKQTKYVHNYNVIEK